MMSRLKWAGHVERMEGERLTKRADGLKVEGGSTSGIKRRAIVACDDV